MLAVVVMAALLPLVASTPARADAEVVAEQRLSARLTELQVYSPALARVTTVRVLTPAGFDASRDHLPVLFLLHGGFGNAADWTAAGKAVTLTEGLPLIVVMPYGGIGGWYTDWRHNTMEGKQRWETYHVDELRRFIEARYRTRTDRAGRAVVGLSMGGFGAMHYATRHPDLFGFAAAFSGAVDLLHPGVSGIVGISPLAHAGLFTDIFGDRLLEETRWRAHNPVDLAANLATVETQLRTGNGMPGGRFGGGRDIQEMGVSQATAKLHNRLTQLGIADVYDDYGPGAHTWDYWADDLRVTLPRIVASAAEHRAAPTTIDHIAFEPAFSVWGFDVRLARTSLEVTKLSVRPDGFGLRGSGRGTVTTPARYTPGQVVRAVVTRAGIQSYFDVRAGADGRLIVPVNLGPANLLDQYLLGTALPVTQNVVEVELED